MYSGEWAAGKAEGSGVKLWLSTGVRYVGNWRAGCAPAPAANPQRSATGPRCGGAGQARRGA
jgi:hypothetical protein